MKKNPAIIFLLATALSSGLFGQSTIIVPIDGAIIVHQQSVPSEDKILLAKIDSVNCDSYNCSKSINCIY